MAIDPNILLQQTPVSSPLENFAKLQQVRLQQEELRQRAAEMQQRSQLMPGQLALQQQALQSGQQEISQRNEAEKASQALDLATKQGLTTDEAGNPVWNRKSIAQSLVSSNQGHLVPVVFKNLDDADEALAKARKTSSEAAEAQADYGGGIAAAVKAAGYSPAAFIQGIGHAVANKAMDPNQARQLVQQVMADPTKVKPIVDQLIAASPKQRQLAAADETAQARTTEAGVAQAQLPGKMALNAAQTQEAQQRASGQVPITPYQQQELGVRRAEVGMSAQRLGLDKQRFAQDNALQQDPLAGVPPAQIELLKKQAAGEIAGPRPGRKGYDADKARILAVDPTYDDSRFATVQSFKHGKDSQNLGFLSTTLQHLESAQKSSKNLGWSPGESLGVNTPGTGKYNFDVIAVTGEIQKLINNGGATVAETEHIMKNLHSGNPSTRQSGLDEAVDLIKGKVNTISETFRRGTNGLEIPVGKYFNKESQDRFRRNGLFQEQLGGSGGGQSEPTASQSSIEALKKKHNITY